MTELLLYTNEDLKESLRVLHIWNRSEIKSYVKDFLRLNYWKAFLVVLIIMFLIGDTSVVRKATTVPNLQYAYNNDTYDQFGLFQSFETPTRVYEFTSKMHLSPLVKLGI